MHDGQLVCTLGQGNQGSTRVDDEQLLEPDAVHHLPYHEGTIGRPVTTETNHPRQTEPLESAQRRNLPDQSGSLGAASMSRQSLQR